MSDEASEAQSAERLLNFIRAVALIVFTAMSLSVEVFLHFRFGERYLSAIRVLIVYCVLPFILSFSTFAAFVFQLDIRSSSLVPGFAGMFLMLVLAHTVLIHLRNRVGIRWHSQSDGLSYLHLLLPVSIARTGLIELVIEPLVCVIGGILLVRVWHSSLGLYIAACGIALVIKAALIHSKYRDRLLNIIDGQIESEHFAEALRHHSPTLANEGFAIPLAGRWSDADRESLSLPRSH